MAITLGTLGQGNTGGAADTFIPISVDQTPTTGRMLVVHVAIQDTTVDVSGLSGDVGVATWTRSADVSVTGIRAQTWTSSAVGNSTGTFVRVNFTGSTLAAATMQEWAGVAGLGTCTNTNNTTANPSIALTTQDSNNQVSAGFASIGSTLPTAGTGTLDHAKTSSGGSPVTSTATHNPSVSPASVTNSLTLSATTWIAIALELRSTIPGGTATPTLGVLGIGS